VSPATCRRGMTSSVLGLTGLAEVILEYAFGFAYGWAIFQALFMRDMVGGSYRRALTGTFIPELLSTNLLTAGMMPTAMILKMHIPSTNDPVTLAFWFVMSMGLLVGFVIAYPMNRWLANYLKQPMTMRPASVVAGARDARRSTDQAAAAKPAMSMAAVGLLQGRWCQ